jgi:hypothetical protein
VLTVPPTGPLSRRASTGPARGRPGRQPIDTRTTPVHGHPSLGVSHSFGLTPFAAEHPTSSTSKPFSRAPTNGSAAARLRVTVEDLHVAGMGNLLARNAHKAGWDRLHPARRRPLVPVVQDVLAAARSRSAWRCRSAPSAAGTAAWSWTGT